MISFVNIRNLLFTIKNCLSKKKFQLLDLPPHLLHHELSPFQSILQSYPIALVSFIHRPTPSGDHTPQHDLEFFDIAFHEYQLCSLLLESREDSVDSGDIVYLYCLYHQDCTTTTTSNDTSMNTNPF